MSLRAGIERFDPLVLGRKAEIDAWNKLHAGHPVTPASTASVHATAPASSGWLGTLIRDALVLAALAAVVRWPRTAWLILLALLKLVRLAADRVLIHHAAKRRRRRAVALRASAARTQRFARPHHVYDELF
jgi:hypothetical protein